MMAPPSNPVEVLGSVPDLIDSTPPGDQLVSEELQSNNLVSLQNEVVSLQNVTQWLVEEMGSVTDGTEISIDILDELNAREYEIVWSVVDSFYYKLCPEYRAYWNVWNDTKLSRCSSWEH